MMHFYPVIDGIIGILLLACVLSYSIMWERSYLFLALRTQGAPTLTEECDIQRKK